LLERCPGRAGFHGLQSARLAEFCPAFGRVLTAGIAYERNQLGGPAATGSPSACLGTTIRAPVKQTDSDLAHHPSGGGGGRSVVPNTSTLGPAPLTTAGIPSARRLATSAAVSGMTGARYGWCRRSSVASSSTDGSSVSPW